MDQVYDVCHNVAKVEEHDVGGRSKRLVVHRKGATRSFGPGRPEVPAVYRAVGQPVIIPGSMGTASLPPGRDGGGRGPELRLDRPRRRPGHVAARGPAALPRRKDPGRPGPPGHRAPVDELERASPRRPPRPTRTSTRSSASRTRSASGRIVAKARPHRRHEGLVFLSPLPGGTANSISRQIFQIPDVSFRQMRRKAVFSDASGSSGRAPDVPKL